MGKKKFNKANSQKFYLLHRSRSDASYAGDEAPSDFVLVPAEAKRSFKKSQRSSREIDQETSEPPSTDLDHLFKKGDHINEYGLVNNGYDYSKHFKEIGGGGKFITANGKIQEAYSYPSELDSKTLLALPPEALPSTRSDIPSDLQAISISEKYMDEDLRNALFEDEDEEGPFEELQDDFVSQILQTPEIPDFDFDAHIARLIAASERDTIRKPPPRNENEEEGEEEDEEEEEEEEEEFDEDEVFLQKLKQKEMVAHSRKKSAWEQEKERRLLERELDSVLAEYEDDKLGYGSEEEEVEEEEEYENDDDEIECDDLKDKDENEDEEDEQEGEEEEDGDENWKAKQERNLGTGKESGKSRGEGKGTGILPLSDPSFERVLDDFLQNHKVDEEVNNGGPSDTSPIPSSSSYTSSIPRYVHIKGSRELPPLDPPTQLESSFTHSLSLSSSLLLDKERIRKEFEEQLLRQKESEEEIRRMNEEEAKEEELSKRHQQKFKNSPSFPPKYTFTPNLSPPSSSSITTTASSTMEKKNFILEGEGEGDEEEWVDPLMGQAYLREERVREQWDCESVLSTLSNLENHPTIIREPSSSRYRPHVSRHLLKSQAEAESREAVVSRTTRMIRENEKKKFQSSPSISTTISHSKEVPSPLLSSSSSTPPPPPPPPSLIVLSGKLGLPLGYANDKQKKSKPTKDKPVAELNHCEEKEKQGFPSNNHQNDNVVDDHEDEGDEKEEEVSLLLEEREKEERGKKRETPEEKAKRKKEVKESQRLRRQEKSALKDAFKRETVKVIRVQGRKQDIDHANVFRY